MLMDSAKIDSAGIEQLRSRIGVELRIKQFNTVATQDNIKKFVESVGDGNPLWLDPTYAQGTRYGSIIAPPTFLYSVLWPSGALAGGLPGVHSFHGGNDWQFFKPIRLNDRILASARLIDVTEKQSRYGGRSVIVTVEVNYKNQFDELVAIGKGWSIRAEREAGRKRGKYLGITPYGYTTEEIQLIEQNCLSEQPRGAKFVYWDDIVEGDKLPPLAKGPLSLEDVESFISAIGCTATLFFRVKLFRRHPGFFYRDPNTNCWEAVSGVNIYDYAAQAVGIPRAYDLGSQRISWLGHLLTNWMGDDGFLEKLYVKLQLPNLYGDTQWCKGRVSHKYTRGEHFFVDCDVWCENQRREQTAVGTATVRLPSRKVAAL